MENMCSVGNLLIEQWPTHNMLTLHSAPTNQWHRDKFLDCNVMLNNQHVWMLNEGLQSYGASSKKYCMEELSCFRIMLNFNSVPVILQFLY
jgi:hypothetical protein